METWLKPQLIWFVIGFILIIAEFVIPGVVTVFFGIGAWIVAVLCLFLHISVNVQLFIFIISSVFLLSVLRRKFRSLFTGRYSTSDFEIETLDEFVGQKVVVTKEITPERKGKVEFHGTDWDAEAYENLPVGTMAEIIDKNNITLVVKSL